MKRQLAWVGLCGLILLAGCGGAGIAPPPPQPLQITSPAPPSGTTGVAYASSGFTLGASGGKAPYTWAPASGSALPPGLSLSNGVISGIPTAAGTYNVALTVTDSQSPAAKTTPPQYAITISDPAALTITSGTPPGGVVGSIYALKTCGVSPHSSPCPGFQLTASGGVPPYSWSWTGAQGSSTPPGLRIMTGLTGANSCIGLSSWRICGTPSTVGTYNAVVTLADSASPPNQVSATYPIQIKNPPPPVIAVMPLPVGAVNLPYIFTFTVRRGFYPSPQPLTWSETGALPAGLTLATSGALSGTPTATGSFPVTVTVTDGIGQSSTPVNLTVVVDAHGFKATTGSMAIARASHTATLLQDGRVLIAGGVNTSGDIITAEIYDPNNQSFSLTNNMLHLRPDHTATLLKDGRILIAGGNTNTAELYNPNSGGFVATGSMSTSRSGHTATLLPDDTVLIAGGDATGTAELFDPSTGTFRATTGTMTTPRSHHTATLLNNGLVLLTGGFGTTASLASAELYDPSTGHFTATGSMALARDVHAATLLNNNTVLITGGVDSSSSTVQIAAEIYSPGTGTFSTSGNMVQGVFFHTATLLANGQVLVAGGIVQIGVYTAELYDPVAGTFTETGSLTTPRYEHTTTLLSDGTVLVVGGRIDGSTVLNTAELYQ